MNPLEDPIQEPGKSSRWYKIFLNKYLIVGAFFVVWMVFFDQNSYFIHKELDKDIQKLSHDKNYYQEKLKKETIQINRMKRDSNEIERIAREKHYLKKENEDVFIVEEQKIKNQATNEQPK
ncbi:FtsB family cell division protein [Moheibacter sediminis]|uniref:Septum formation initiator n=1 Tax=Moheibacter sediminis TaxID=1434700 RepID=A0A1W2CF48_9FLAO|nr:septum formation initiator family protein [Moheibacter sediminis]SMC83843.1 Septum formation initiator [Moheibacter sediminis]